MTVKFSKSICSLLFIFFITVIFFKNNLFKYLQNKLQNWFIKFSLSINEWKLTSTYKKHTFHWHQTLFKFQVTLIKSFILLSNWILKNKLSKVSLDLPKVSPSFTKVATVIYCWKKLSKVANHRSKPFPKTRSSSEE